MRKQFYLIDSLTEIQQNEVKKSVSRLPNGNATYPSKSLKSFERFDVDVIYGLYVGYVVCGAQKWDLYVEHTPIASQCAFGFANFSIYLKEV